MKTDANIVLCVKLKQHFGKCSSVSWPFKWNKCIYQSNATLVSYIKNAVWYWLEGESDTKDAIIQKEPYESMSGVCQKHNNDSVVMWEEITWSDQVSHNSERYLCVANLALPTQNTKSTEKNSVAAILLWCCSPWFKYLNKSEWKTGGKKTIVLLPAGWALTQETDTHIGPVVIICWHYFKCPCLNLIIQT